MLYACAQSCPTLHDPMDSSLPGSSVYGIFQARILGGCHFPLQEFFPTQRSNPHLLNLLHCRRIIYHWAIRSVAQSCLTLCNAMNRSTPGLPVHHQLPEFTQTHVHWVGDAIQPSHPLSSPSPLAPNPSQHQSLFQWVNSSHEVAKVLELQL